MMDMMIIFLLALIAIAGAFILGMWFARRLEIERRTNQRLSCHGEKTQHHAT